MPWLFSLGIYLVFIKLKKKLYLLDKAIILNFIPSFCLGMKYLACYINA